MKGIVMQKVGNTLLVVSLLCACLFGSGCTKVLGDFTLLTSKNINLSDFSTEEAETSGEMAYGEDVTHIIIFIPTGGPPNLKEAVDRALDSKNAYMLTNARISYTGFYIPYIYGQMKYEVKGYPVIR